MKRHSWYRRRLKVLSDLGRVIPVFRKEIIAGEYKKLLAALAAKELKQTEIASVVGLSLSSIIHDMKRLGVKPANKRHVDRVRAVIDEISLANKPLYQRRRYSENIAAKAA